MNRNDFGLIGLAVMGQNLVLNIERNGFSVAVFNRTAEKTKEFLNRRAKGKKIVGTYSIEEFVKLLERPRRIIIMVKAGKPVDELIANLKPYLNRDDILIDAGNSFFKDTERRAAALENKGIRYVGMGVSGGEEGALKGPSIMPGGPKDAYRIIEPVITKIAARVNGENCCTYIGPGGAGHYTKMVHNGIEYGIMQLICETYDILRTGLGLSAGESSDVFGEWNTAELNSYLIEITVKVLSRIDPETNKPLVDLILDTAGQKGTGKWTSQNAFDLGVPVPTINAAVEARILSAHREERLSAARILRGPKRTFAGGKTDIISVLKDALHASIITSYAQGMALLRAASIEYGYGMKPDEIAKIWRGGCIIRAKMLEEIRTAYRKNPSLANLMVDQYFSEKLNALQENWRSAVNSAVQLGIPCPAMSASLNYFDAYRQKRLPANLLQAQRDYFGAHTYQRIDMEGVFHTIWEE
ncbi:MAG: NADP-dependent phosphogluconate dehydrogenase [Fidelibacterota bacterium]